MSDPLSVTASVAGLVVLALQGVRLLVNEVNNIKEAPKSLENLQLDLTSVQTSLKSLENIDESQLRLLGEQVYNQSAAAIERCTSTCHDFRNDLQRWTKRSRDGKLSWRDKTNIGLFKEQRIDVMSRQLQNCKLTLHSVAVNATLYATFHSMASTEEIKKMLNTRQAETTSKITTVDGQMKAAQGSLVQLHQIQDSKSNQQEDEDRQVVSCAITEEVAMLRASQEILMSIIASLQAGLAEHESGGVNKVFTNVSFGANNHGFQVGTVSGPISGKSFGRN